MTRGELLNNPGNIEKGEDWQGLCEDQPDARFCKFIDPEHGFRAMSKILQSYKQDGVMTLASTITRWSPSFENDTPSYISDVSERSGILAYAPIDLASYAIQLPLVKAICFHEQGEQIWPDAVVIKGLALAGIHP